MATSRSPRVTFITPLALTFVVIVTMGVTGNKLSPHAKSTKGSAVAPASPVPNTKALYGGCPVEKGYVLYNKRCLKLYTIKREYYTARSSCETDEAHLFYFKSREEDGKALQYLMNTMGQVLLGLGEGLWVGANDIVEEGNFRWYDRTPLSRDSGLWGGDQPDDSGGIEDCVEVYHANTFVLNDNSCSRELGFVCQVNIKKQ